MVGTESGSHMVLLLLLEPWVGGQHLVHPHLCLGSLAQEGRLFTLLATCWFPHVPPPAFTPGCVTRFSGHSLHHIVYLFWL